MPAIRSAPGGLRTTEVHVQEQSTHRSKLHGIRLSGPSLGRPKKSALADKKTEYIDNADRIEVERSFSLAKRCYGLGWIMTKLDVTTRSSIAMSIFVMNVSHIAARSLRNFLMAVFSRYLRQNFVPFYDQKGANELLAA